MLHSILVAHVTVVATTQHQFVSAAAAAAMAAHSHVYSDAVRLYVRTLEDLCRTTDFTVSSEWFEAMPSLGREHFFKAVFNHCGTSQQVSYALMAHLNCRSFFPNMDVFLF